MTILSGSHVVELVGSYRLAWISGRYGSFKSLFALELAEHFLKRGYRLITNMRCAWADPWDEVRIDEKTGRLHAVVIMDEAGLVLKGTEQMEAMCSYSRKMDVIYLFPSFMPPVRYAQVVNLHSVYGFNHIGIPIRVWKCRVKIGGWRDETTFSTTGFHRMFGIYSTQSVDCDTESVIEYMAVRTHQFIEWSKNRYTDTTIRYYREAGERLPGLVTPGTKKGDGFADAAGAILEAADDFAAVSTRARRRR